MLGGQTFSKINVGNYCCHYKRFQNFGKKDNVKGARSQSLGKNWMLH